LCGDNERYLYLNFRNYKILNKIIFQKLIENYWIHFSISRNVSLRRR
jgi:hypothetical protein